MRSLIRRSASEKCQQVVKPKPGLKVCGYLQYGLFPGSQKLSLAFHLMPSHTNKFKKSILYLENFVSCGARETTCLNQKNGCFDRNHLVWGIARPQGWETARLLGLIFFPPTKQNPSTYFSSGHGSVIVEPGKQDLTGWWVHWKNISKVQ